MFQIEQAGEARDALIAGLRAELEANGCAVLKGFIRADRLAELVAESDRVAAHGHRHFNRTNAYFTQDHPNLPQSHRCAVSTTARTPSFRPTILAPTVSCVRSTNGRNSRPLSRRRSVSSTSTLYADPLADVIVNLAEAGNGFPCISTPITTP